MSLTEHLDATTSLVGVTLGLTLMWWLWTRRPTGIPPSPGPALPLLGHLHLMEKDPRAKFHKWRQQYGDMFSLYMGKRLVIVFCGFPLIKEAFVKFADVFSDRPHMFTTDKICENRGVILTSGATWKEQRKTSLEILREFGMGKNVLAEKIQEEVINYTHAIEDLQGAPSDLHRLTNISVSNNICSIIFGKHFEYDDPVFISYLETVEDNFRHLGSSAIVNFLPWLEHIPGDVFGVQKILTNVKFIKEQFFQPQVDAHVETFTEGEATDFIYAYLHQMKKNDQKGAVTTLSEPHLVATLGDLFIAGTETTSTAIQWALLYFLHNPHVQDKCYQEICDVIGTDRLPNIRDRAKMVYLEATINEVLRKANIAPFAVQHATPYDVSFRGYVIPKDAIILPFLDTVLYDPEIWGDPENFRPERFIDVDGGKVARIDEFIPFGIGRRSCMGEALSRMELFLYLCTLVQHFRFLPPEPDMLPPEEGTLGATYIAKPYKIRAVRRE